MDLVRIIQEAGAIGWLTLGLLGFMSVFSWAVIYQKWRLFSRIRSASQKFLDTFWQSRNLENLYESTKNLPASPPSLVFQAGYVELVKLSKTSSKGSRKEEEGTLHLGKMDNIERSLRRTANSEVNRIEKYLPFLATTGATAPFIGLFGTVVGIMRSFHQIGLSGTATIADVAPGISEALLATAAGLAAAIPAVIAFNQFQSKVRVVGSDLESFSADFLNIVKRHFVQ